MSFEEAYKTVKRMVDPGGCAWHEVQTHKSLTKYLIEETYELLEAIDTGAPAEEMVSELADVLYQVLFHAALAEKNGEGYNIDTVTEKLTQKLVKRHPHVFGDRGYMSVAELEAEWEHLKEAAAGDARGTRQPLDGIPKDLPTLQKSAKIVDRLMRAKKLAGVKTENFHSNASVGSDQNRNDNFGGEPNTTNSVGERLLAIIKEAVSNGIDPDLALREATNNLIKEMEK